MKKIVIKIISALKRIIEKPDAEKSYLELAKSYKEEKMYSEAESIMFLIEKRFNSNVENSNFNKEQ